MKKEILAAWASLDWMTFRRYTLLKQMYGNLENAWEQINEGDLQMCGETEKNIQSFLERKKKTDLKKSLELLEQNNIQLHFYEDEDFLSVLKNIDDAPVFLYSQGVWKKDELCLSVVGTRSVTSYGKQVAQKILPTLTQSLTLVSGLALGVDTLAHEACVENKTRTIAVLGGGLLEMYPRQNVSLAEKIIETGGCIISEFSPNTQPQNFHFPKRNRIVSALGIGTLIIEGKIGSGSLITARLALEQNKEVFAVPGNISSLQSSGTNQIIQKGEAKLVTCAEDVLEDLHLEQKQMAAEAKKIFNFSSQEEEKIYNFLKQDANSEGKDVGEISAETGLITTKVISSLTIMEMKGMVFDAGMSYWKAIH